MVHALSYIIFILVFSAWLGKELKHTFSLKKYWWWIAGAVIAGLFGSFLSAIYDNDIVGNFLLHSIGGGVATSFLFVYVLKTLNLRFNWRLNLFFLFAFVSLLGVLNELAEYAYESLGLGIMSIDTHDTWRDFVANTTGAFLAWLLISLTLRLNSTGQKKMEHV